MASGTIITTGTGAGLGTAIAIELLKSSPAGTHNIFTVRPSQDTSSPTYTALQEAIKTSKNPSEISHLALDDLSNIRSFAKEINTKVSSGSLGRITALILNAGVQVTKPTTTKDGFEITYQVNYLANVLLVFLLLPSLAPNGRIVYISSDSHDPKRCVGFPEQKWPSDLDKLAHPDADAPKSDGKLNGMGRYALSKVALVMHMYALQRRLDSSSVYSGITTSSVDPGWMATSLIKGTDLMTRMLVRPMLKLGPTLASLLGSKDSQLRTTETSAKHVVAQVFDQRESELPKAVFIINGKEAKSSELSYDEKQQEALWAETMKQLNVKQEDIESLDIGSK